jgi:hypothetical protein
LAGYILLQKEGGRFASTESGQASNPLLTAIVRFGIFEAHPPQTTRSSRVVSYLQVSKNEWYQGGKKADRAAQLWPGYVQFLVYIVQKPPAFSARTKKKQEE